jgi:F-type H+-transporting ATPase subunit f
LEPQNFKGLVAISLLTMFQAIGAAQDAARMERVVNFYARLPRGAAPAPKPTGLLERYQARYFNGKKASPMRKHYYTCVNVN